MIEPVFPPLFQGLSVQGSSDPFDQACREAQRGCEAGLVVYNREADRLRAALVFAPEVPLQAAMIMLPLCAVGFQNALGALAPPEVAVQFHWDGRLAVNGGLCGGFRISAATRDPEATPDWLVIGLTLPLWPASEETGLNPDQTALYAEGCADVDAIRLLESWVKHTLVGINRWTEEGTAPLHREWNGLALGIGDPVTINGLQGVLLGVDEGFGMLIRDGATTHLLPLTYLLERDCP